MLNEAIRYFTDDANIMACLSVTCGDAAHEMHAMRGFADLAGTQVGEESLYDLASLTKLFTALTVMRLHEEGLLDLTAPAQRYAPMFTALGGVTVDQLLGFEVALTTPQRIDTQPTAADGLAQLYAVAPSAHGTGRYYSDMHAMVLGHVVEGAAGMALYECISKYILQPLDMRDTWAIVPQEERRRCISYNGEHRLERGKWIIHDNVGLGVPHDPKARLLYSSGMLCGHAGLFSTRRDMTKLCQGLLAQRIVSRESMAAMARNRLGRALPEGGHTQYLGSQCYVKHPNQYFSEVPVYMSDQTIALSGFTGHHLSVDPETGLFALFLGNRVMNRLSVLVPEGGKTRLDYGLHEDGSGTICRPDGVVIASSVDWVHQKDARLHRPVQQLLGVPVWRRAGSEWP